MFFDPPKDGDSFKEVTTTSPPNPGESGLHPVIVPPKGCTYPVQAIAPIIPAKQILGLRKSTFWLLTLIAILTLALIGLGVGLGVGLGIVQNSNSASQAQSPVGNNATSSQVDPGNNNSTTPSTTTVATATSTDLMTTTITVSGTPTASSICPGANNMIVTQGSMRYRIYCDSDFGGEKTDLASVVLPSFNDCLSLCNSMNYFQDRTDVGCTYNVEGTGSQTPGTCWCLGGDKKTIVSNKGNDVARPI